MYKYSFNKVINSDKLKIELQSLNPCNIETVNPDTLNIYFESELSFSDESILANIVASHDPVVLIAPIIPDVTPRQIRQALVLTDGITIEMVEAALETLPEPTKTLARIEWEYSVAFQRNRPLVTQVGLMLGWTEEQLDNLWLLAGSL